MHRVVAISHTAEPSGEPRGGRDPSDRALFSVILKTQPSQNTTTEGSMSAAVYMIHDCTPNPCSSENRDTESTSSIQNLLTKREHSCTLLCIATN